MKGVILQYDAKRGEGLISGEDGARYPFSGVEFQNDISQLAAGAHVDFEASNQEAKSIFAIQSDYSNYGSDKKSKIATGLFAILLGGLGVHKFYLGHTVPGVILLLISVFGWLLFFIPNIVIGIVVLIEGIIILTKSDEDFHQTYVVEKRVWF